MPKAFLLTNKRYDLYNLNIPRLWKHVEDECQQTAEEKCVANNKRPWVPQGVQNYEAEPAIRTPPEMERLEYKPRERNDWSLVKSNRQSSMHQSPQFDRVSDYAEFDVEMREEPVNLSIKKIDLFNLTQLAEVSLAASGCLSHSHSSVGDSSSGSSEENESLSLSVEKVETETEDESQGARQICNECGKGFSTLSNLARHRQTHRSPSDSSAIKKCPHCDKVYVSMPAFSMHLRTHNQGCKCPYCGKGFSRPWLLQGHIRTHTGEKPFKCNVCGKAFADKSNLRAHTQTHSTEKPFICSRCGKTFALKSYLCKHIESSCMRTNRGGAGNCKLSDSASSTPSPPPAL